MISTSEMLTYLEILILLATKKHKTSKMNLIFSVLVAEMDLKESQNS